MRTSFFQTLVQIAEADPRIVLLTGDLGFMALEPFVQKFPERFFNVGVAEQNMVGLATGLAEAGFIPFTYSITPFSTLRPYEIIRNGPILHQLPVRIVGMGGGFEYGHDGITHYGLEDIGLMRIQPEIAIIAPADGLQTRQALLATWDLPGPVYYRLGKDDRAIVPGLEGRFEIGRVQLLQQGADVLLVTMGSIAPQVEAAARQLLQQGIKATVAIVASIRPEPREDLTELLSRHALAITVEAHYATGGLGALVSDLVTEKNLPCRVIRRAVDQPLHGRVGSTDYLYDQFGISEKALVEVVLNTLRA